MRSVPFGNGFMAKRIDTCSYPILGYQSRASTQSQHLSIAKIKPCLQALSRVRTPYNLSGHPKYLHWGYLDASMHMIFYFLGVCAAHRNILLQLASWDCANIWDYWYFIYLQQLEFGKLINLLKRYFVS